MIEINHRLSIPESELRFTAARASGPGGQHVNTTATAVTLIFDVERSTALTDFERMVIKGKLARRINKKGELLLTAQNERSQEANKRIVTQRFAMLLRKALAPIRKRVPTGPTRASQERRIQAKKRRGAVKRTRRARPDEE